MSSRRLETTIALAAFACLAIALRGESADANGKLAQIAPRMRAFVDARQISGAVTLVARSGKIVEYDAVGEADLAAHRPMTKDTLFAIASMTKPITATAVMILADEGKLSIDDPASKYVPQFKEVKLGKAQPGREITIRDLMTHTSGVPGDQGVKESLEKSAAEMAARPLAFEPGTKWQYSPGLTVCGRIIEVASGEPYHQFLAKRIFAPLGMKDTTFDPSDEQKKRTALTYKPSADKTSLEAVTPQLFERGAPTYGPSGGLFSTAADMARFYLMILNGGELDGKRIVSPAAVRQMTTVQTGDLTTGFTPGNGWGLGWCVVREPQGVTKMLSPGTFGHGGAWGTQGWVDPQRQIIYILMIQRRELPNSDASEMRDAFQQLASDALAQ